MNSVIIKKNTIQIPKVIGESNHELETSFFAQAEIKQLDEFGFIQKKEKIYS